MTDQTTNPKLSRRKPVILELGVHELHMACTIMGKLSVGGDVRQLVHTAAGQQFYSKLVRAREQLREEG